MSMKDYDFSLPANKSQEIAAQGRYIYYLKGTTPNIDAGIGASVAGNQAIRVRAGSTSIVLIPGQSFRIPATEKQPSAWRVENVVNAETISGTILVGEGDFRDSNTSNTSFVKLDASFANNVAVTNDAAHRVPVTLDTTQRLPVSLDLTQKLQLDPTVPLNIAGSTVQYTNSWADASTALTVATPIFTPGQNPNGAYIEFAEISIAHLHGGALGFTAAFVAKNAAPASITDGDLIMVASCAGVNTSGPNNQANEKLPVRIKIPAGKGLYLNQSGAVPDKCTKTVLFTLL